jgi:hypothetical protein
MVVSWEAARALHERLFRATITMQGETRVPIAIGMRKAIDVCWGFRFKRCVETVVSMLRQCMPCLCRK